MRRLVIALLGWLAIAVEAQQLPTLPACGAFEQQRWLADLQMNVPASGHFSRQPDGLLWQLREPVQQRLLLSTENSELALDQRLIADFMQAMHSADRASLEAHFSLSQDEAGKLLLTPHNAQLADIVSLIRVSGQPAIEQIELQFSDGDRLQIQLHPAACPEPD